MTITRQPDALCMTGNMSSIRVATDTDVTMSLASGGSTLLTHTYSPTADNIVDINLKDIIHSMLSVQLSNQSTAYQQTLLCRTFTVTLSDGTDTQTITFKALRAGVDNLSDTVGNFLQHNFLTWQPNVKPVTYYTPEFLTYYAQQQVVVKCLAHIAEGNETTVTLATISADTCVTIPVQYAIIAGLTNALPQWYDVWVETGGGTRLTYIQRYYAQDMRSEEEQWVLFENSLGGFDTFRAYGDTGLEAEHTHNVAEIEEVSQEYRVDTERKYKQHTGRLDKYERQWLLDFFPSQRKYIYVGQSLRQIVVVESDVNYKASELPSSYTFTYRYADAKPYLNLPRTDVPLEVLDIQVPDVGSFTVAPRLVEFPATPLSDGALFPVQDPYSEEWGTTTFGAIRQIIAAMVSTAEESFAILTHTHLNKSFLDGLSWDSIRNHFAQSFLSKTNADTANGVITFAAGLVSNTIAWFKQGIKIGSSADSTMGIDAAGNATLNNVTAGGHVTSPDLRSDEVPNDDNIGGSGYHVYEDANDNGHVCTDYLDVRKKARFTELEIRRLSYINADQVQSMAASKVEKVVPVGADGSVLEGVYGEDYDDEDIAAYRCLAVADDGSTATKNGWALGDQARCQTFNISTPGNYQNVENRFYWRLVVRVGQCYDDGTIYPSQEEHNGKVYHFFDLANIMDVTADAGDEFDDFFADEHTTEDVYEGYMITLVNNERTNLNDIPATEDAVVQMGNKIDTDRMGFFITKADNLNTGPYIYAGVDNFTLVGKMITKITPAEVLISARKLKVFSDPNAGDASPLTHYRGDWTQGSTSYYYDEWDYQGSRWLCLYQGAEGITCEPGTVPQGDTTHAWTYYWKKISLKGDSEVTVYKQSATQPATPTGNNIPPAGWQTDPGWFASGEIPGEGNDGIFTVRTVHFNTTKANQEIKVRLEASTEENYDFVIVGSVDEELDAEELYAENLADDEDLRDNYNAISGVDSETIVLTAARTGSHFIQIAYTKDSSASRNGDYGRYWVGFNDDTTIWASRATFNGDTKVAGWSTPVRWNGEDGNGILSVTRTYARSTQSTSANDSTAPAGIDTNVETSGWASSSPAVNETYPYLWAKEVVTYTNNTQTTKYYCIGARGANGVDAQDIEWAYIRTKTNVAPVISQDDTYYDSKTDTQHPNGRNYEEDDHLPKVVAGSGGLLSDIESGNSGNAGKPYECTDDPKGVTSTWKYEWEIKREKGAANANGHRSWAYYYGEMTLHNKWTDSPIVADLDNEMDGVACDAGGDSDHSQTCTTTASLLQGSTKKSFTLKIREWDEDDQEYNEITQSGSILTDVVVNWTNNSDNSKTITFTFGEGVTVNDKREFIVVMIADNMEYKAVFTVNGVLPGANGEPATIYNILPSLDKITFARDANGGLTPPSKLLSFMVRKAVGGNITDILSGQMYSSDKLRLTYSVSEPPSSYNSNQLWPVSSAKEDTDANISFNAYGTATIPNSVAFSSLYLALFKEITNGNSTSYTLLDRETIPVIKDGANGKGVSNVTRYFYATSSNSTPEYNSSTWKDDIGDLDEPWNETNKYLWCREMTTWSDGSASTWSAVFLFSVWGKEGEDGIIISVSPPTIILTQSETEINGEYPIDYGGASTSQEGSIYVSIKAQRDGSALNITNAGVSDSGNTCTPYKRVVSNTELRVWLTAIVTTNGNNHGQCVATFAAGGVNHSVIIPWYANLLGTWKTSIENGIETSISSHLLYELGEGGIEGDVEATEQVGTYVRGWAENTAMLTETVGSRYNGNNLFGFSKGIMFNGIGADAIPFVQGYGFAVVNTYNGHTVGRARNLGFDGKTGYYVVTCEIKMPSLGNGVTAVVNINLCDVNPESGTIDNNKRFIATNQWKKFTGVFNIPSSNPYVYENSLNGFFDVENIDSTNPTAQIFVRYLQIERGSVPSAFGICAEDAENISEPVNGITWGWTANSFETVTDNNGPGGTTNYIRNTVHPQSGSNIEVATSEVSVTEGIYTLSFWAKSNANNNVMHCFCIDATNTTTYDGVMPNYLSPEYGEIEPYQQEGISKWGDVAIKLTTEWKKYYVHYYADGSSSRMYLVAMRINGNDVGGSNGTYCISQIKFERGYVTSANRTVYETVMKQTARNIDFSVLVNSMEKAGIHLYTTNNKTPDNEEELAKGVIDIVAGQVNFKDSNGENANAYVQINDDGTLKAVNGEFSGKITANEGSIGNLDIEGTLNINGQTNGLEITGSAGKTVISGDSIGTYNAFSQKTSVIAYKESYNVIEKNGTSVSSTISINLGSCNAGSYTIKHNSTYIKKAASGEGPKTVSVSSLSFKVYLDGVQITTATGTNDFSFVLSTAGTLSITVAVRGTVQSDYDPRTGQYFMYEVIKVTSPLASFMQLGFDGLAANFSGNICYIGAEGAIFKFGSYGLKIDTTGVKKLSNGSWVNI